MAKQPPFPPQIASDQPPAPPREYPVVAQSAPPPVQQPSSLRKATPHHSSPTPGDKQKPPHGTFDGKRQVSGTVSKKTMPMHVTKHPNPVGRPKQPRGY